jgi:hypothetical protein
VFYRGARQGAGASCESRQALEKAQNGNGQLLEKVGMDLGLAPRLLGVGATSVWGWRRGVLGLVSRRLGVDGRAPHSQGDKGQEEAVFKKAKGETPIRRLAPFTILALRFEIPFIFYYPTRL